MTNPVSRLVTAAAMTFMLTIVFVAADQVRRQSPESSLVPLAVSLKVGGDAYDTKAQGSCTHAPQASIYGVASKMWMVRHQSDGRSVQLTFWKPDDGSTAMFSLAVTGKHNVTLSTVRGGQVSGSGVVTLVPSGKGGTFTIDAKDKTGQVIAGTLTCGAFTPLIAEGGD